MTKPKVVSGAKARESHSSVLEMGSVDLLGLEGKKGWIRAL